MSGYHGNAGDGLTAGDTERADGMAFSTPDSDRDKSESNCAKMYASGWWFNDCFGANLNGEWAHGGGQEGLVWCSRTLGCEYVTFSEMKLRYKQ